MTFKIFSVLPILFFLIRFSTASAQLLNDEVSMKIVQKSLDKIYNYEFEEAVDYKSKLEAKYPGHPVIHIIDSFILFWKYLPVKDNPAKAAEYIKHLNDCLAAVDKRFGKESRDPEAVFYTMVARGYLAMLYNYKGELLSAAGEGKKAHNSFVEGLKLIRKNPEFYFTAGMYNYYIEVYPELHPIVKPVLIFFKNGDKALGVKQMDMATRLGTITKAEACYYLSYIYIKYENKPEKAVYYMQQLVDKYPQNPVHLTKYLEALILSGRFDETAVYMQRLKSVNMGIFQASWHTFQAMLLEKHSKYYDAAQKEYLIALKSPHDDQYTPEYIPMAYAGLARIEAKRGNIAKAREYYKKCLAKAEYSSLIKEAKAYK